jgi:hypothetical protein
LSQKLKLLKNHLKDWNKKIFGNVHDNVKEVEEKLQDIQNVIDSNGHSDSLMNQEKQAQVELGIGILRVIGIPKLDVQQNCLLLSEMARIS